VKHSFELISLPQESERVEACERCGLIRFTMVHKGLVGRIYGELGGIMGRKYISCGQQLMKNALK
jgi:hypothetical protein